ncbi:MAG: ATP-binding protein [Candidatus Marsarchaeota archaeon]|jgi:adenylate kinase|nr:ATP-binding protein [Candidatus Marsarchaeota archaeon]
MIVFSTATAGSNRSKLELETAQLAKRSGKKVVILNLVDEMIKAAMELNKELDPSTLPNLDAKVLNVLKEDAIHAMSDRIAQSSGTDYIIDGHTSFWWRNGPISLLDIDDFRELKPDFFITIASPPGELSESLKSKSDWSGKQVDIYDMLLWSEVELYTADLVSKTLGKPNYVIGVSENPITLFNLMYKPDMLKIYASYSMEHRDIGYGNVTRFVSKLREIAIVFDPRSVDLGAYRYTYDKRLKEVVFNQTVRRDYHMIDQADMVVIHLSRLVYSSGVDSERMHAHSTGKKVLLYFPFEKYSPFTPYFVDKMFNKENELLDEIKETASNKRGRAK